MKSFLNMTKNGIIATVVVVLFVIAAIVGCVVALNNSSSSTITYDLNYTGAPAGEKVVQKSGSEISEPWYAYRTDYTLAGWYEDKECTKPVSFPYKVNGNATLYAKWTTDAAAKYFNENFFFDNQYGKALAKSRQMTTDFEQFKVNNKDLNVQFVSYGLNHFVVRDDTKGADVAAYVVVSIPEKKVLFTTSADRDTFVKSISSTSCANEFIVLEKGKQYWIYDMCGNKFGPSLEEPAILHRSMVVFDGNCYTFDNNGNLRFSFKLTSPYEKCENGGNTHCRLDGINIKENGEVHYDRLDVLDSKFNVVETVNIPGNAVRVVCFHLFDDKYLLQYSMITNDSNYTYRDNGVRYKLASFIIDGSALTVKNVDLPYPAFAKTDMSQKKGFVKSLSHDISNVISFYKVDENKNLNKGGKLLWSLNQDGTVYKKFSLSESDYSFSYLSPLFEHGKYLVIIADKSSGTTKGITCIVDGSGEKFVPVITGLKVTNCWIYFIKEAAYGDSNIYDANGKVVGNFEGKTFVDSTNNVMFFKDGNGNMFMFRDGKMTEMPDCKGKLICKESFFGYNVGTTYKFFTESGKQICESQTDNCRDIETASEIHIAEFYLGNGNSAIFIVSPAVR